MESHRSRASVWLGWAQPLAAIDFSASWLGFAWTADAAFAKGGPSPWLPAAATLFALSTLSWTATAAYAIAHERDADDSFAIRFGSLPPPPPPTVSGDDGCAGGTLEWTSGADVLVLALHDDGRVSQRGRALAFLRAHPDVSVRASLGPLQSLLRIDPAQRCAMLRQGREAMNDAEIADARRSCAIGWRR